MRTRTELSGYTTQGRAPAAPTANFSLKDAWIVVAQHTSQVKPEGNWEHGAWEGSDIDSTDVRINKRYADAFWESDLDQRLQELGVDRVVLTGFLSNICVLASYFGAMVLGYDSRVLESATAALGAGLRSHVEAIVRTVNFEQLIANLTEA